ncbi:MAG: PAS domain S-box protein [Gemmatimonadales bacterium]|nr:MAG: PAS domain S-box protein [Gemmatimonadales bacterium]
MAVHIETSVEDVPGSRSSRSAPASSRTRGAPPTVEQCIIFQCSMCDGVAVACPPDFADLPDRRVPRGPTMSEQPSESEDRSRFREMVESAHEGIWEIDADGRTIFANARLCELLEWPHDEILGRHLLDFILPEDHERAKRHFRERLNGEAGTVEHRFLTRSGEVMWAMLSSFPRRSSGGPRGGSVVGMLSDITQLKRTQEALEHSRTKYRTLVENSPDVIVRFDRELRHIFVNRRLEEIGGIPRSEYLGRTNEELGFPTESVEFWNRELTRVLESGESNTFSFDYEDADGVHRYLEARVVPEFGADGRVEALQSTVRDISDRVRERQTRSRLEERLRHQEKLESLGVLVGGIAHDFNNILMTVIGNAELAIAELAAFEPPNDEIRPLLDETEASLRSINKAADQAAVLCRQMLTYAGESTFELRRVDLCEVVREMDHLLETSISKNARLVLDCPDDGLPIRADAGQLRQLLLNLTLNASEAIGGADGEIVIEVAPAACDPEFLGDSELADQIDPGDYARVSISDNGEGMDDETRARIFEPFYTTRFAGRGLGLASTLGIVRGHGGGLTIDSTPEQGTAFHLYFPLIEETPEAG